MPARKRRPPQRISPWRAGRGEPGGRAAAEAPPVRPSPILPRPLVWPVARLLLLAGSRRREAVCERRGRGPPGTVGLGLQSCWRKRAPGRPPPAATTPAGRDARARASALGWCTRGSAPPARRAPPRPGSLPIPGADGVDPAHPSSERRRRPALNERRRLLGSLS